MILNKFYSFLIFILIISACASVTSPTGGPKDEIPPTLLLSNPPNETLNFNSKTITLTFDEFVDLKNHQEQILVTPRLSEDYETIVKRKTVSLKLNEELLPNTTYTINFRDAIVDITESNPAINLKLAFSTGNYIDSAFITGQVISLKKQIPLKSALVGAYFASDTLTLLNQAPDYMTITDDDGYFRLDNLKPGKYRIYALQDKNKNSILDFKTEAYGFLKDTLSLDTILRDLLIPVLYNDQRPMELQSSRPTGKYYVAKYNKYISEYTFGFLSQIDSINSKMEDDHQSIKFYNTLVSDSLQLLLTVQDTLLQSHTDTINLKFVESPRSADEYTAKVTSEPQPLTSKLIKAQIKFSKPSMTLHLDSIHLFLDTLVLAPITANDLQWNKRKTSLLIHKSLDSLINDSTEITKLKLKAGSRAFVSIEKDTSQQILTPLTFQEQAKTGIIEVQVQTTQPSFIIQLLSPTYQVIKEMRDSKSFSFSYLKPGKYMLRALIDSNSDGIWNPGNIHKNIEPEPVHIYTTSTGEKELTLKANWVLGPNVLIF